MLLDEFVDFRVRAGEAGRQEVERERARRVQEHAGWLRSVLRGRAVSKPAAVAAGVAADSAGAVAAEEAAVAAVSEPERELARAAR